MRPELAETLVSLVLDLEVCRCILQLNWPVGSQQGLDNFRLSVEQVVEDGPGGAEIGVSSLVGAVSDLKGQDVTTHIGVERL